MDDLPFCMRQLKTIKILFQTKFKCCWHIHRSVTDEEIITIIMKRAAKTIFSLAQLQYQ